MKDRAQKEQALKLCVSKRWLPQLEVDVHSVTGVSSRAALMTDLDVLAAVPDDFRGFRSVVFDCKTLSRESPINRSFWLRGVLDRMGADYGVCVLKKNTIEADHKLIATDLRVVLLAEDEFEIYARATSPLFDAPVGHSANISLWEKYFGIPQRFSRLQPLLKFCRSEYWMFSDSAEACRKTISAVHDSHAELNPAKPEHLAIVADAAALLSRSLAFVVSYLFHAYLHPTRQSDLEDAIKVSLYGGRESYEHRNRLYRMLREKSGGDVAGTDLTPPEWNRFVQLMRQLLDAPTEISRAALLLKEVSFALLSESGDLEFARSLAGESPQGARFAVLVISYLIRATRLPPEFGSRIESVLIGLQRR